jgi:hypothetical protein
VALPEGDAVGARLGFSHFDPSDFRIDVGDEGDDACAKGTLGPAGHLGDDLAGALDPRHVKIQVCGVKVRPGPAPSAHGAAIARRASRTYPG